MTSWLRKAHIRPRIFADEVVSFGYLLATTAASLIFVDFVDQANLTNASVTSSLSTT